MALIDSDTEITYQTAIRQALAEEMARDPNVIIMGEAVGARRAGAFAMTQGLMGEFGPKRVIATPMSDSALVGAAIGAALLGQRPVVELQGIDHATDAFNQIVNMAAKLAWRTYGEMYAPLVIRGPAGGGTHGGPWGSLSPEAWFAHAPGLKIVVPTTPYDAKGLLKAAIRDNNPVLFLEQRYLYRRLREELPEEEYIVPIGQAEIRRPGDDVTILTYGALVYHALDAADLLAAEGIAAEVIDLRTLVPLDRATILASVRHTGHVVIAHEASKTGGFGAELAAIIAEEAFDALRGPIMRVAAPDTPYPAAPELEAVYLPGVEHIVAAARRALAL